MCACVNILVRVYSFLHLSDLSNQTDAQFDSMTCSARLTSRIPHQRSRKFQPSKPPVPDFWPKKSGTRGKKNEKPSMQSLRT